MLAMALTAGRVPEDYRTDGSCRFERKVIRGMQNVAIFRGLCM